VVLLRFEAPPCLLEQERRRRGVSDESIPLGATVFDELQLLVKARVHALGSRRGRGVRALCGGGGRHARVLAGEFHEHGRGSLSEIGTIIAPPTIRAAADAKSAPACLNDGRRPCSGRRRRR